MKEKRFVSEQSYESIVKIPSESRYFLKPSSEKLKHKKLYGFDIETYGENNKFLMGSIVNETEEYVFWDKKRMQDFIIKNEKLKSSYLFATNLGFDFTGLFDTIDIMREFKFISRGSDFITIQHKKTKAPKFFDTMNFFKCSVANLGHILKIPKLEKPDFLGQYVNMITEPQKAKHLQNYNIRDSYISFRFAKFLQDGFNSIGGNLKYTIASTSMGLYRKKFLKHWILQPPKEIIKEQFNAYYGGRVESFERGLIRNKNYYDINSLYPYVMATKLFPFPNSMTTKQDLNLEGISLCNIETPKNLLIPLLPLRHDNKLLFPLGKFQAWQTHAELRKAIDLGYKIEILKSYTYEKNFNPFSDFVNEMYSERMKFKKNNSPFELIYKILLNSLYGKFAQKMEFSEIFMIETQKDLDKINDYIKLNIGLLQDGKDIRYKIDSPCIEEKEIVGKIYASAKMYYVTDLDVVNYPKFINPIISIYTTSYARLELYKWIEKAGFNNVSYCDTDSLITTSELPTGTKLGELKKELSITKGIIVKPKFYYVEDENNPKDKFVKAKGLHNLKTIMDFKKVLETQEYEYTKFTKFRESLRRDLHFNQKLDILKIIDLEDNKRLWKREFNQKEKETSQPLVVRH